MDVIKTIKLIATDLDGTLMSADHLTVTQRTVNTLRTAHEKGIKIAIATGRPMCIIGNVVEQVPFVDYIIYSNGACVYDRNTEEVVYSNLINGEDAADIIKYLLGWEVFFDVSYNGESHYQLGIEKYFENMEFPGDFVSEVMESMNGHKNLAEYLNGDGVEKITLYTVKDEDFDELKDKLLSYHFSVATSFKGNLEATVIDADKGNAVAGICEEMQITADEVMAFGDAGNDCRMLEFAKYSFAMENATDECKASAKFVTLSNADDGLAVAVEKYAL